MFLKSSHPLFCEKKVANDKLIAKLLMYVFQWSRGNQITKLCEVRNFVDFASIPILFSAITLNDNGLYYKIVIFSSILIFSSIVILKGNITLLSFFLILPTLLCM